MNLLEMVVKNEANIKFKYARGSIQCHHIAPHPEDISTRVIIKNKVCRIEILLRLKKKKEDRPLRKIVWGVQNVFGG